MPYKYAADGSISFSEVNGVKLPLFVHADGKEAPFDADSALGTITARNAEARSHREAKEAAEGRLRTFDGITDPAAALKALTTVKNLDEKQLIAAGDRDRAVSEAIKATEALYAPFKTRAEALEMELIVEKIGGAFSRSKFIAEKIAAPTDMVQATFGPRFKLVEGKVVATTSDGNQVFSRTKPGEPAEFEEALEILVDQYPHRAAILKGTGASGGGAQGGGGNGNSRNSDLAGLPPVARLTEARRRGIT